MAALLASLVISFVTRSRNAPPEPTFAWVDPAQFAAASRPGKIKALYYKALWLTAPIWKHLKGAKPQIRIASKILAVRNVTIGQLGIGVATGTNESATRAWILSPSELDELKERLKGFDGVDAVASPTILTSDGMAAMMFSGQTTPSLTPWGMMMYVTPRIAAHQLKLAMNTTYSEAIDGTNGTYIRTNLSAACRVLVPSAGGVLIAGPDSKSKDGTNYC